MPAIPEDVAWVGKRVKEWRTRAEFGRLTRAALAQKAGVNDRTWGRVERGAYEDGSPYVPSEPVIRAIANVLEQDPGPLLARLGYAEGPDAESSAEGIHADPDAGREGHGGTEGWPAWLENWLRSEISAIRQVVAEVAQRVADLERRAEDPPA